MKTEDEMTQRHLIKSSILQGDSWGPILASVDRDKIVAVFLAEAPSSSSAATHIDGQCHNYQYSGIYAKITYSSLHCGPMVEIEQ